MLFIRIVYIVIFLLPTFFLNTFSQEADYFGARNESLARTTVALNDSWALFYNPAGLEYNKSHLLFGYQSKYIALGINDAVFAFTFPIKNTALGIGASYFGDNLLNKTKLIGAAAHTIGTTSLGLKVTYEQLSIAEVGSNGFFYIDLGGQIKMGRQFVIGMALKNLNQSKSNNSQFIAPNTLVQVGIDYHPHSKLILLAQIEKDISNPPILRLGMEYKITKHVSARTGLTPYPTSAFAGLGFTWTKMNLDFAGSYQQILGWSGGLSIGIPIDISNEK